MLQPPVITQRWRKHFDMMILHKDFTDYSTSIVTTATLVGSTQRHTEYSISILTLPFYILHNDHTAYSVSIGAQHSKEQQKVQDKVQGK